MDGHQLQGSASSQDAATKERRCGDDGMMKESFGTKALGIMRSHKEALEAHAALIHRAVATTSASEMNDSDGDQQALLSRVRSLLAQADFD